MTAIKIILIVAALCYIAATYFLFVKKNYIGFSLAAGGWLLNAVVVVTNWVVNGYVPFVSMYQVVTFLGFCFPITYLFMHYVKNLEWTAPIFALCCAIVMIGACCMDASLIWHFPPALQSPYFVPHVFSYMLSYTLCAVGFVLTLVMMAAKTTERKAEVEKGIYSTVLTAFPFMLLGMFLGALWANECWGAYWAWDPKENWSLVTMCLYALYFHIRKIKNSRTLCYIVLIAAFIALLMTFVGVGLFGATGSHNYA